MPPSTVGIHGAGVFGNGPDYRLIEGPTVLVHEFKLAELPLARKYIDPVALRHVETFNGIRPGGYYQD